MSNTNSTSYTLNVFAHFSMKHLLALTLILCTVASTNAQDESNPKRGFYPGGSYAVSDIETINTANGNLILTIPIASLPPGRGGSTAPGVSLIYNSKIWDAYKIFEPGEPGSGEDFTFNYVEQSPEGGWRFQLPVYSLNFQDFVPVGNQCNGGYIHKLMVKFPDGSRHEFYPSGYTIKNSSGGQKYSQIRMDGWKATEIQTSGDCFINHTLQTTNTMTYYSVDGSYLRLDVLHDNDQTKANPWILYFPDGTRVETPAGSNEFPDFQRTYDRNNNYTDYQRIYNYNGQSGQTVDKLSDEFGRYILIDYGYGEAYPDPTVKAYGVNNEELTWTISWNNPPVVNKTYCTHFAPSGCDNFFDVNVSRVEIDQITLPTQLGGLSYHFTYNASSGGWGELSSVTLPSGAIASYQYEQDGQNQIAWHKVRDNGVARKDLSYQLQYDLTSTNTTDSWFYSYNHSSKITTITAPDNGVTKTYHQGADPVLGEHARGLVRRTERADGSVEENVFQTNTPSGMLMFSGPPLPVNPFIKTKFISITNSSGQLVKTAVTDYSYDKNGNITAVREYDWVDYSSIQRDSFERPLDATQQPALTVSLLKRLTTNLYFNQTPDASDTTTNDPNVYTKGTSPRLRSLIAATEIGNGSQIQARSEFAYDDPNLTGNLTQSKQWDSTKGVYSNSLTAENSILTSNLYEVWPSGATGKLVRSTDAKGIQTKFSYGTVGDETDLYPTLIQTAFGTPVQRTQAQEYDFYTGLITKTTDVDNSISTKSTYDAVGRPTLVQSAFNLPDETQTATEYFDSERRVVVRSDQILKGDAKLVSVQHYDQLGRVRLTRQLEDSSVSQAETSETIGIKVQTRYKYTNGNSHVLTSNPYRAATSQQASTEPTMGWTHIKNDVGGRIVEVQTFGGSGLPAPWESNITSTGTVSTSYDGYLTTVSDQAQRIRRSRVDALGRLVRIDEPVSVNGIAQLGSDVDPLQPTSYTYDALGNLLSITQGNRTRNFSYSSLSRLTSAQNPENGTVSYKYDDNGNLKVKTDARLVSAHFTYDQLNRVTKRWYNNSSAIEDQSTNQDLPANVGLSPEANFYYDAHSPTSPFFSFQDQDKLKGRLTAVTYGSPGTEGDYYRYDVVGRVFSKKQQLGTKEYSISAQYNRANQVTLLTYPSNRTISSIFDAAGRLSAMSGNLGGRTKTYATGILYTASGSLTKEQFGTNNAIFNKRSYNSRQQLAEILASTTDGDTWDRGKILNQYSLQCAGVDCNATDNNGNLRKQEIYIPSKDQGSQPTSWYQQFDYDELNRLKRVHEYTGNLNNDWQQEYDYDRWGNRTINGNETFSPLSAPGMIPEPSYAVDSVQNNNRLTAPAGYALTYDEAGNVTTDTYAGAGVRKYNAENRMTQWGDPNGSYSYDASSQRVRRMVNNQETWQIYGLSGELLAEYPANGDTSNPQKEYGYRNGQLLVTAVPVQTTRQNFALRSNGGSASASSEISGGCSIWPARGAIDGDRKGSYWGNNGGWADSSSGSFSNDWFQVDFDSAKTIDELDIFTLQDNYSNPTEPTEAMTFSTYGLTAYSVSYWNGSAWINIPEASVVANNKVWRKFTFSPITTTKIRVLPQAAVDNGFSRLTEVEAWGSVNLPTKTNVALRSNGGVATASSEISAGCDTWPARGANDGDRKGAYWGGTGGWADSSSGNFSNDWLQIDFAGSKTIDEIDVFTLQDNYANPIEPTDTTTFSTYGLTAFDVSYWNGSSWAQIPETVVTGNNKVWRKLTFSAITTTKIRVFGRAAVDNGRSRIAELEAWSPTDSIAGTGVQWLIMDHLGTPRMLFDESGELGHIKRHDYLPFGEELPAQAIRTADQGYSVGDGVRQGFTSKERDSETGLDYFLARYYSSGQGRFSSPDEFVGGPDELFDFSAGAAENPTFYADLTQPQSLNKYQYCLNDPLIYVDPDGHQQVLTQRTLIERGYFNETFKSMGATVDKLIDKGSHPLRTWDEIRDEVRKALGTDRESIKRRNDRWFGPTPPQYQQFVDVEFELAMPMGRVETVERAGVRIVSRIGEDKRIVKLAEEAGRSVQQSIDHLTSQLAAGNFNPGLGTRNLFGNISYARTRDGARVFFRRVGEQIEILAKSNKKNEPAVIDRLKKLYQR